MRLAYVCSDFGIPIHGDREASVHVRERSRAIQRLGHEVVIFSPRRGGPAPIGFDIEICDLGLEEPEQRIYRLLSGDPSVGDEAAREIRALLYAAALRYRLHGILGIFRPDAIYERYSPLGSGGQTLARGFGIPLILEVSDLASGDEVDQIVPAFGQTIRELERAIVGDADRVVAATGALAARLVALGVPASRITVLRAGVDVDRFAAGAISRGAVRANLGIGPEEPVVGMVGAFESRGGAAALIQAVATLRRSRLAACLLLVGDGPERPHLEALARAEGLGDAAVFTGPVPYERLPAMLAAMDVAIAPAACGLGAGGAPSHVLEAMAAGRPVVAAAASAIGETLRDGETGLLYQPGDTAALAEAVAALLINRAWAARLGRAAQASVRSGRTWESHARAVVDLVAHVRMPTPLWSENGVVWG